ncbi:MAG TPA: hypothetical protein VM884_09035 [Flavisolibacter sp.]|nr:hypothetical protein [Flavisolibacter sp.]
MRKIITGLAAFLYLHVCAQENDIAFMRPTPIFNDTTLTQSSRVFTSGVVDFQFAEFNLKTVLQNKAPMKKIAGYSKKGQPIYLYYFPGTSNKNALVIGGVHGSELSSIEVVNTLVKKLLVAPQSYYNVILIPSLFPDNALAAAACKKDRVANNKGRYSEPGAVDPNRQMPMLGKPFYADAPLDAHNREIEKENRLLLQLIQAFAPQRVATIHAIRDKNNCGVFADPRTDCNGMALGFQSDSALVMLMAKYIDSCGGLVAGNSLSKNPGSRYYLDPKIAEQGTLQERNVKGSGLPNGMGVSLGTWASTAVCDDEAGYSRAAMRLLTVEFPGYKKPAEYKTKKEKEWCAGQVAVYASSIYTYFLQPFFVEENLGVDNRMAIK